MLAVYGKGGDPPVQTVSHYPSPLGDILLSADGDGLTGLWFDGAKYYAAGLGPDCREGSSPALEEAERWLDLYFSGREPDFLPPLHAVGSPFQRAVWDLLLQIPRGRTATYGDLARRLPARSGGAVGRNKISILIPCHRVVGVDGRLTGYAGGIARKQALLELEGAELVLSQRSRRGLQ